MDRQVITAPEALKNAWMDMLPVPAMSQEQRETQYRADVDQVNRNRQGTLKATSQATRDHWQGTKHREPIAKGHFRHVIF